MGKFRVQKTLTGFSCAHRQWKADSHCSFVHGYDRSFTFWIEADELDSNGWVFDFGGFRLVRKALEDQFDHTLVLASDDPSLDAFRLLHADGVVNLKIMDHPGMEGAASWVFSKAGIMVSQQTAGRATLVGVEARENDRNAVRLGACQ